MNTKLPIQQQKQQKGNSENHNSSPAIGGNCGCSGMSNDADVSSDPGVSNTAGVIVKIERQSSSPSTFNNNSIQSNEIAPTAFNYDLKISSPISWALESIKTEKSSPNSPEIETTTEAITKIETSSATTATVTPRSALATASSHTMKRARRSSQIPHHQQHSMMTSINLRNKANLRILQNQSNNQSSNSAAAAATEKKYRIMFQNHRIRKESLEHSDDMIYNPEIEKPWICKNCKRNYKWKNSLKCHLKNECGLPPRYFCNKMCGYRTNVHSNLKRHLNTKCKTKDDDNNTTIIQQQQ